MIAHLYIAYHNVMILVESCYNKLSPTISDTKELVIHQHYVTLTMIEKHFLHISHKELASLGLSNGDLKNPVNNLII